MNELSKQLMCILLRNGVEIWEEKDRIQSLIKLIGSQTSHRFIEIGENLINTADISGIFAPDVMETMVRRKNGQWQDKKGLWRNRGDTPCPICGNILPFGMKCGNCGGR